MLVLYIFALSVALDLLQATPNDYPGFLSWKHEFQITYGDNFIESMAYENFRANKKRIDEHNDQYWKCKVSYSLGLWEKSDQNASQLNIELNGLTLGTEGRVVVGTTNIATANVSYFNYAEMGYVTGVLNQGNCGSCWAFSCTGALEGQIFKNTKVLMKLSEMQLVECVDSNNGCNGGNFNNAFNYIRNNGITTSAIYPYKGRKTKPCSYDPETMVASVTGFNWIAIRDEIFLRDYLFSFGPLCLGLDASLFTFQSYRSGIYDDPECSNRSINHAVLLVGFGADETWGDYWIIKNSYGTSWGEKGYMRIARGKNRCGLRSYVVSPNIPDDDELSSSFGSFL